ncbi:MAG: hypothetical protein M9918_11125 [Anaerolineae bacterium]|nr:hypothetical protein [Anaerolineae bacterium]
MTQDGRRAVSASDDSTLKVWNLETGTLLTSITLDDQMLAVGIVPTASSTADRLYFTVFAGGSGGGVYYLEYREA